MESRVKGIQKEKAHLYKGLPLLRRDEFYSWAYGTDFIELLRRYKDSGYDARLAPSIDREDTSKGNVEVSMKTIVHYKNGQQHTVNHLFICCTEWTGDDIKVYGELWPDLSASEVKGFVDTFKGVLFLEEVSKGDGVVKLHFSPEIDMSVKVNVMTAKQRAKDWRGIS